MSLKTSSDTLNASGCMLTYITDTKAAECFRAKPFRHGRQRQDSVEMGGGRTKAKQSSTAAATSLPPQRAHGHFAGPSRKVS